MHQYIIELTQTYESITLDKSLKALCFALTSDNSNQYEVPEARDGTWGFSAQVSVDMILVVVHAVKLSASPETAVLLYPVSWALWGLTQSCKIMTDTVSHSTDRCNYYYICHPQVLEPKISFA